MRHRVGGEAHAFAVVEGHACSDTFNPAFGTSMLRRLLLYSMTDWLASRPLLTFPNISLDNSSQSWLEGCTRRLFSTANSFGAARVILDQFVLDKLRCSQIRTFDIRSPIEAPFPVSPVLTVISITNDRTTRFLYDPPFQIYLLVAQI